MDYDEFRQRISHKVVERLEWRELATFVPNKKTPIFNWFYYKEGFAKELVEELLKMFEIESGTVLDPFCGSGTTLLACKQHGVNAVGFDVLPVSVFAARVKTMTYDERFISLLKENAAIILSSRFSHNHFDFPSLMNRAFSKYALSDIALLRRQIGGLAPETREFFTLALITAAVRCSYARKDGSVLKFKKRPAPPLRKMFQQVVKKMIRDCEKNVLPQSGSVRVDYGDARRLDLDDDSIDAVITSPPYLNNIDYTKVYSIEEFFIYGEAMPSVRAYIGMNASDSSFLDEIALPLQARLYFDDMNNVIGEMYRVLKKGGKAAIVVGNGFVDDVIESDMILAYLAEKIGFEVEKILVLNKRFALENRTVKKGVLRESLIILKK
jgi:DNA modification methylase